MRSIRVVLQRILSLVPVKWPEKINIGPREPQSKNMDSRAIARPYLDYVCFVKDLTGTGILPMFGENYSEFVGRAWRKGE